MKWVKLLLPAIIFILIDVSLVIMALRITKNPIKADPSAPPPFISALVIPHHDIVKTIRLNMLSRIAKNRPDTGTAILLSPSHFSLDQTKVFYADRTWSLSGGTLSYDEKIGGIINAYNLKDNNLVLNDHGIYNILPDLRQTFTGLKVVPLLIGNRVARQNLDRLASIIINNCPKSCLLVASVDFSHYLPYALADIHDQKSLRILSGLEQNSVLSLEVDSPQSLYLLTRFARAKKTGSFHLFNHTNSAKLENQPDAESTSHIFGWYDNAPDKNIFNSQTFLYAHNPLLTKEITSGVGDRFIYGTDYTDIIGNNTYSPVKNLQIIPAEISSFQITGHTLKIFLGPDLAVAGNLENRKTTLAFLPLNLQSAPVTLLRSPDKITFLSKIFPKQTPGNILINRQLGIVEINK